METQKEFANHKIKTTSCHQCGLKQSSVFQNCADELLDELFSNKQFRQYGKNEILIRQNDSFEGVFCIQEGTVKVSTSGNKNKDFILWFARPGDMIGIDSFINNKNHSFTAITVEPVSACFVPDTDFKKLVSKDPAIARKLMKVLCEEINFIETRITSISQKSIREQFAEVLISIATKNKKSIVGNTSINYSIKDLANIIGTTNNYLYKILSDLNEKNVVSIRNKKLVIKDFDKLSLIAIGEESVT
ncbi:MAG: Crp/Fnr family transcriptional regulator [Bacteroidetes bacterium]|nr:Crp/Fnr family transcriptional regulator [Bacteroidota bacterium]